MTSKHSRQSVLHWIVRLLGDKQNIETEKKHKDLQMKRGSSRKLFLPIKQCKKEPKNGSLQSQLQFWIDKSHWNILEFEILNNFLLNAHDSRTEFRIYLINGLENKCILQKYMILTYCVVFDF